MDAWIDEGFKHGGMGWDGTPVTTGGASSNLIDVYSKPCLNSFLAIKRSNIFMILHLCFCTQYDLEHDNSTCNENITFKIH